MTGFELLTIIWIAIAVITFLALTVFKIRAPYGRHSSSNWGPMMDNRIAWIVMELPALLLFPLLVYLGPSQKDWFIWLLVTLWLLHYVNRTIIFPLRIKTKGKKMPVLIVGSAILFNGMNGFINGFFLGFLYTSTDLELYSPQIILGLIVFISGMLINHIADSKLIALRKEKKGYQIPKGWLFEYVSCPNHFGEIVEWFGFAIIAWNVPAFTFAIWTFCNLVPRTLNHHAWYAEKFSEYPKNRKAVIPFIW